ncbi:TPA: hypothetical protein KLD64_001152 [Legionella pneumophila]|nr:hypothetical protein [Legionella pneumophila]
MDFSFEMKKLWGIRESILVKPINLNSVQEARSKSPRRYYFSKSRIQKHDKYISFGITFPETIKPLFEEMTGLELFYSDQYDNYWRIIKNETELNTVESWENSLGSRVFLRDCLGLSIAMSLNFNNTQDLVHTEIGQLEYDAKNKQDESAIDKLVELCCSTIQELPFYNEADCICAVPHHPSKEFDLPSIVVRIVSSKLGKTDITNRFTFDHPKISLKSLSLEEKWFEWEKTKLNFHRDGLNGKTVIIIDDKYQSGTTIEYIAMKIQEAGVGSIYGLCFVKTMRDTDNV